MAEPGPLLLSTAEMRVRYVGRRRRGSQVRPLQIRLVAGGPEGARRK
jgi:hypothetical protein